MEHRSEAESVERRRDVMSEAAAPSSPQAGCDTALFRKVAGHWATGVAVVTTVDAAGRPFGLTMSAVTSLSLSPMQFLICVDERSDSLAPMLASGFFCINLLAAGQEEISRRFASKLMDKFTGVPHRRHGSAVPVLDGTVAHVVCRITAALPGGDHRIIVGEVLDADAPGGEPLLHFRGGYRALQ
ncbi:MAG TPA: flavin reductase family protein [Stellaceae bacterium]|nr:flavin reductase family protein [Stellaceae bacterium]